MTIESRPIDAKALSDKIHEYMRDYPNATARLTACRAILSMLGDENQTPTQVEFFPDSAKMENQSLRNAANGFKARAEAAEARAEKAERERDEAVSDLETIMVFGDSGLDTCDFCKNNQCYARSGNNPCLPKWRGRKED